MELSFDGWSCLLSKGLVDWELTRPQNRFPRRCPNQRSSVAAASDFNDEWQTRPWRPVMTVQLTSPGMPAWVVIKQQPGKTFPVGVPWRGSPRCFPSRGLDLKRPPCQGLPHGERQCSFGPAVCLVCSRYFSHTFNICCATHSLPPSLPRRQ